MLKILFPGFWSGRFHGLVATSHSGFTDTSVNMAIRRILRGDAQDDVEIRAKFSDPRIGDRFEIDQQRFARRCIRDSSENSITFILCLTVDQHLGGADSFPVSTDRKMNVRCSSGIGDWLDGAKIVNAARIGKEASIALEIAIAFPSVVVVAAVDVNSVLIDLPDLDDDVAQGRACFAENPAAEMGDFAKGRSDRIVYDDQIVIGIERHLIRVERAFGKLRRDHQFLGKQTAGGEK